MYLSLVLSALFLLGEFCISYFVFDPLYLYYEIWWLDIPMHILGGFGVAWFFISLFRVAKKSYNFRLILLATLVIAITWEIYEYLLDILAIRNWNGWFDTIKDLIDGMIGAMIAYKVFSK